MLASGAGITSGCAIEPAAGEAEDDPNDGWLNTAEVTRHWRLDAELVCLSACETGLGPPTQTDGYQGLSQAVLKAGARSVLVSLWSVDDAAQALLMSRFYENLVGGRGANGDPAHMSKAEALREAKEWLRTFRDAGGSIPFAHPAYWSGFVLIGDPD